MKKQKRNAKAQFGTKTQSKPPQSLPQAPDRLTAHRALWAAAVLAELRRQTGADLEDAVSDLLADLMHWCDRFDQSFAEELHRARNRYETETGETSAAIALHSEEL